MRQVSVNQLAQFQTDYFYPKLLAIDLNLQRELVFRS